MICGDTVNNIYDNILNIHMINIHEESISLFENEEFNGGFLNLRMPPNEVDIIVEYLELFDNISLRDCRE